jgi:hypothetical protein
MYGTLDMSESWGTVAILASYLKMLALQRGVHDGATGFGIADHRLGL